ncbi:MAG TPA: cytochrome C oxidase subunit IV family protein [Chitinophagaceae bacterium]|nr:cytochrome C oxidase subunit IV family protein [Chitinophagaceae bacterium]
MQHPAFEEVTVHHHQADDRSFKKKVIKTTVILSIITAIELGLGLTLYALKLPDDLRRLLIKGVIIILSLSKAYYIVSIFMHLGDEIRNMIMTIVVPLMLFIWFILAFILDGNSYKNLRNKYDKNFLERTSDHAPKKADTLELKPGARQ